MLTTGQDRPLTDTRPPNAGTTSAEASFEAHRKRTGGLFGRLPKALVLELNAPLSAEATFLLAHRSLHIAGKGWGCSGTAMAKTVRAGFSLGVFKRAVREAKGHGHLEREQGRSRKPGRGRGYAVDRLTFDTPERDYVMVERDLFDGTLTPTEITTILYLRARGDRYAAPWQLMKRLGPHGRRSAPFCGAGKRRASVRRRSGSSRGGS